jgi:hypothetical protein
VKQESAVVYWLNNANKLAMTIGVYDDYSVQSLVDTDYSSYLPSSRYTSAFTVGELGLLLPEWCSSYCTPDGVWKCDAPALYGEVPAVVDQVTEADARAIMLLSIYYYYPSFLSLDVASLTR